jgi:hypothetical protein
MPSRTSMPDTIIQTQNTSRPLTLRSESRAAAMVFRTSMEDRTCLNVRT